MLDIASLFIGHALAQNAAPATAPAATSGIPGAAMFGSVANFLPMVLIFAVFYVLIIRPQQKKIAEQDRMIKALKRGDRIVTTGGIHGKISKLEDDHVMVEVADGVNIKLARAHVQGLSAKTDTVAVANDDSEKK